MELLSDSQLRVAEWRQIDAGGKGGDWKKSRLSQDPCRLNSDKRMEQQDRLHIGIQEKNPSMKDIKHDRSD
jgi:hypothetical protein